MNDKKHIDRVFQERFKDFEATPSDAVWENIEAQLNKKKRRVIPIWWRYAGIAALLLLLLTVGSIYFTGEEDLPINTVVETENEDIKPESEANNIFKDPNTSEDVITNNDSQDDLKQKSQTEEASDKITPSTETSVAETTTSKNKSESDRVKNPGGLIKTLSNQLIKPENNSEVASNSKEKSKDKGLQDNSKNNTTIASNREQDNNTKETESSLIDSEKAKGILTDISKNNTAIAKNEDENIDDKPNSESEKDKPSIEDAIKKDKEIIEEEKKSNRWSIAPNAAPVYFNSLGEGSSIDPQFNSNSKSTEQNMSYGIKASYAINKKISVRSGINKVNLGYNTNNVVMFQSVGISSNSVALQNVGTTNINNADSNSNNISLISGENIVAGRRPEAFATKSNTSLNQSLGYIEVPLEIQYALTNKKLGVNVIGGFSSFFLSNNKVFSQSEGLKTFIGEANNINKVSYSANFGLGLNYKFSKKIDLNLEPMFKYQINTFNNTSGDFKPYFIGVYTGFAIKF